MSDMTGGNGTDGETEERDREPARSGKALLIVVFVGAMSVAGGFGYSIGSIGPRALGSVGVLGVTLFQPTPIGMALYGMTATGLALGTIYVGARVALGRENRPS